MSGAKQKKLADAEARRRIRTDLDGTFVVEAAAGTGKTTELVERILGVIREGRSNLDSIVAVTFTEKAAGEMKLRLRAEIERARQESEQSVERDRFDAALAALEAARISTIHAFCADLLRERPIEAAVDPAFEVIDEERAERLLEEAFDGWFQKKLDDPPEGVRRVLRRRGWKSEGSGPREQLLRACADLASYRDFDARWTKPRVDREGAIDALLLKIAEVGELAEQAKRASDYLARGLEAFRDLANEITVREAITGHRDYDGLEAELRDFSVPRYGRRSWGAWRWKGGGQSYGDGLPREEVLAQRDELQKAFEEFLRDTDAELAALLQEELWPVVLEREALKNKMGGLDFVDLLLCARDLLVGDARVRADLQKRISHIFVDEFQDTDPLQAEIMLLLSADDPGEADFEKVRPLAGKLFVVGDPKQSIYRFRRADVVFYERVKQQLVASGGELLHLTSSFRSVPAIQAVVNASFEPVMQGAEDGSQAKYVALTEFRDSYGEQPAVVALPVPDPYGRGKTLAKYAVEQSYPDAVGAFVHWLVTESGWKVEDPSARGRRVPVEARHVCLLFRRLQSFGEDKTRPYVRALEARRVPHVLVGGRSFHAREEVIALRAALNAIEWPDDELSVYATLRGPLFAITDDALLAFRAEVGRLHPLRPIDDAAERAHREVADALGILRDLYVGRNARPTADTVDRLLGDTRAHAGLAIWPTGEQALANVLAVVQQARSFEARGATSFRAFVDWLGEQADRGQGSEAPIVEEGTDGVRVMSIHKAKGLEFPVVILCDPGAPLRSRFPSRHVDPEKRLWAFPVCGCRPKEIRDNEERILRHDDAELVRVGYVAATRARDLLVAPVFGDAADGDEAPLKGWIDSLAPALYPRGRGRRAAKNHPSIPKFGADSVRSRSYDAEAGPNDCVAPGWHPSLAGGHGIVWWDPNSLELDVDAAGGLRQMDLLKEDEKKTRSLDGVRAHQKWVGRRSKATREASVPSLVAETVTRLAMAGDEAGSAVPIERTDAPREGRPRGKRFGTLVHGVLAAVPLDAGKQSVATVAAAQGRLVAATPEEVQAAVAAVTAALQHPVMKRAAASSDCRRETPIAHRLEDGTIAEGVVDLAFLEDARWVVVDFKTDAELQQGGPYARQVDLYVAAIAAATGAAASGLLLSV